MLFRSSSCCKIWSSMISYKKTFVAKPHLLQISATRPMLQNIFFSNFLQQDFYKNCNNISCRVYFSATTTFTRLISATRSLLKKLQQHLALCLIFYNKTLFAKITRRSHAASNFLQRDPCCKNCNKFIVASELEEARAKDTDAPLGRRRH